jgi:hypothetical protein
MDEISVLFDDFQKKVVLQEIADVKLTVRLVLGNAVICV